MRTVCECVRRARRSRHGCAPAMPTRVELDYFIANAERIPRPDQDATLTRLHRVTAPRTPRDEVLAFAFDHRNQFFDLAQQTGAEEARIPRLKALFVEAVAAVESARGLQGRIGMLCDDRYGQDALNAATGRGWWIGRPVELPGSNPVAFDRGRSIGTTLASWPQEHVVKCLVQYHPDDRDRQPARAGSADPRALRRRAGERPRAAAGNHPAEVDAARDRTPCYRAMKRLYNLEHLSRMVEARADGRGAVGGGRCADRRARSALPRRGAAGARCARR